jgi:transposase-like protein
VVITLLAYGCPLQAIVAAFGVDERTVQAWQSRAGRHCQQIHEHLVEQQAYLAAATEAPELKGK